MTVESSLPNSLRLDYVLCIFAETNRPVQLGHMLQIVFFMYKSVNGQVPSYIIDIIPPLVRETTNYPLRNQNNITVPFCRTDLYRKSCIPSSITLWNNLDENLRNSSSLSSFKYALKQVSSNINNVPSYYIKGDKIFICNTRKNKE